MTTIGQRQDDERQRQGREAVRGRNWSMSKFPLEICKAAWQETRREEHDVITGVGLDQWAATVHLVIDQAEQMEVLPAPSTSARDRQL